MSQVDQTPFGKISREFTIFYERKRKDRPWFTKRALARKLKLSPSFVSEIMSGRKLLPPKHLNTMIQTLDIDIENAEKIRGLYVQVKNIRWLGAEGEIGFVEEKQQATRKEWVLATDLQNEMLRNWYFLPMLDAVTLKDFDGDFERALGITPAMQSYGLRRLQELGMLRQENGRWIKTSEQLKFTSAVSKADFRAFHRMMSRVYLNELEKIDDRSHARRLVIGSTVAVPATKVPELKVKLAEFMSEFLSTCSNEEADQVYSLNLNFFPLTKE